MFRPRTLVILLGLIALVYWAIPSQRKQKLRGKFREFFNALVVAMILYWILMLSLYFYNK